MTYASKYREEGEEFEIESEAHGLLLSLRIKATTPRLTLINLFLAEKTPITFSEIIKKSKHQSSASIYRTLQLFVDKNLLQVINTGGRIVAYELMSGKKHHHHAICTRCGDLEDVEMCSLRDAQNRVLANSKKFSSLSHHSLEFFGLCKNCS